MNSCVNEALVLAIRHLRNALSYQDSPLFTVDIEAAIQAVERVRTKVILRERNQVIGQAVCKHCGQAVVDGRCWACGTEPTKAGPS